jgi:EmrB/QacA subfamily drug resistance transporter
MAVTTESHPRGTLVATGLGLFMIFLDATIVNVALPDIQREFDVGEAGLQWVVAAYSLTMGMFMMSSASLADRRGRRLVFVVGIVIFASASVACGLAPGIGLLAVARGVQGVGAAMVNVASLALVSAAYPDPDAKAKAIGAWTGIAAVGLAIGPTVGGLLTEGLGWRSIFLVNAFVGAAAIVLVFRYVGESHDPTGRGIDLPGQILFIVGVGALTYGLIEAPQSGWLSPEIVALLVGSVVVLGAFVVTELRQRDPMMDVRVFEDGVYSTAIGTIFAVLFGIYGTMLVVTQYFQNIKDYSAVEAGFLMLALSLPVVVLAPLAGRFVARYGGRRVTLSGVLSIFIGLFVLAAGVGNWLVVVLVGLALVGSAGGLAVTPATTVAMSSIPPERSGMASGIMSAQRALGSTAGFAIMGSVLAVVVSATLPGKLEPLIPDPTERDEAVEAIVDQANPRAAVGLIGPGKPISDVPASEIDGVVDAADDAFVEGIRAALVTAAVVVLAALIAGFRLFPKGRREVTHEEAEAVELAAEETG